jgi:hypothetical protein
LHFTGPPPRVLGRAGMKLDLLFLLIVMVCVIVMIVELISYYSDDLLGSTLL